MDWRVGHDGGNTEDQRDQNSAGQSRLKKLHEAFHVYCTLSLPSRVQLFSLSMAAPSPKRGVAGKEYGGKSYGAHWAPPLKITTSGSDDVRTATSNDGGDDANGGASTRPALPMTVPTAA